MRQPKLQRTGSAPRKASWYALSSALCFNLPHLNILIFATVGLPVDMWSCGVILYVMLSGCYPFEDDDVHMLHHKITHGIFTFYEGHRAIVSEDAKDLIRSLLSVDPLQRLTVDQALNHPWLQKHLLNPSNPLHQREVKKHASKCTFGKIMNALRILRNLKSSKVNR